MKIIDSALLDATQQRARQSVRLRANHNLHPELTDPIQRMLNAFEPGTYVRPHRHANPDRWELFLILRGALDLLTFDDHGRVTARVALQTHGPVMGFEIPPAAWHSVVCKETGTMVYESKTGPYLPLPEQDVGIWAPAEGQPACATFLSWLNQAQVGDTPPVWAR